MSTWLEMTLTFLGGALVFVSTRVVFSLDKISDDIRDLRDAQADTNTNLAVVISQLQIHDRRITKLEGD